MMCLAKLVKVGGNGNKIYLNTYKLIFVIYTLLPVAVIYNI